MTTGSILLHIIDRPKKAMGGVADNPRSWWLVAVLIVVSILVLNWVSAPYEANLALVRSERMLERFAPNVPQEQMAMIRERLAAPSPLRTVLVGAVGAIALGAVGWLLRGALLHFGSMAAGGTSVWFSTYAAGVWSLVPYVIRNVVQAVYVASSGGLIDHAGLSVLVASGDWLADAQNPMYVALSQVDPFVLWHLILLTAGLGAAAKVSPAKAATLAILAWALFAAIKIGLALLGASLGGGLLG